MPIPEVQFTSEGRVAFLTFNRPEARNAMTWPMYDALAEACDLVDADQRICAFVLRGAGDAFVAGTDISQFTSFASADDGIAYERRMERIIERLEQVSVPTIAQVHGVAAGGGCLIALACDLRVCSPAARFGVPIARTLGNCLSAANCARLVDADRPGACQRAALHRTAPRRDGGALARSRRRGWPPRTRWTRRCANWRRRLPATRR